MNRILPIAGDYISVSRIKRYAQCPKSYELHYIAKKLAAPSVPLVFGNLMHVPLEQTYKRIVTEKYTGKFPIDWLIAEYRRAWMKTDLGDFAIFDEGLRLLKDYAHATGFIEHRSVLGVEQEFRIEIEGFEVLGYMDRIDKIDDETILVWDYKSNRLIFNREDVDKDLQLGVYAIAAKELWPWAKNIRLAFYLLRHGFVMETSRSVEDLEGVRQYVAVLGQQMASATEFPTRLNANCSYCDHNAHCAEYQRVMRGEVDAGLVNLQDLEAVSRKRQELAHSIKARRRRRTSSTTS